MYFLFLSLVSYFLSLVFLFSSKKIQLILKVVTLSTRKKIIIIQMLPIISRKKGNLTKKFGELIKNIIYLIQYMNEYNIYIYIYNLSQKKSFKIVKEVWSQYLCLIFCMIFQEKKFSRYILFTDKVSLSDQHFLQCRSKSDELKIQLDSLA